MQDMTGILTGVKLDTSIHNIEMCHDRRLGVEDPMISKTRFLIKLIENDYSWH